MLKFTLYSDDRDGDRVVHVNPHEVASVRETERRPAFGGWHQVAVITMRSGEKFEVRDGSRSAAGHIAAAQARARGDGACPPG